MNTYGREPYAARFPGSIPGERVLFIPTTGVDGWLAAPAGILTLTPVSGVQRERRGCMTKCIILNASHEPLAIVSAQRGLILHLEGKAHILDQVPDKTWRSVKAEFPIPVKIILKEYISTGSRYYRRAHLNNSNLFWRDDHTCQYCGMHQSELPRKVRLTRDHIMPQSKGGVNVWENVVTACGKCNHRKANRTPQEAGLVLRGLPRVPLTYEIMLKRSGEEFQS